MQHPVILMTCDSLLDAASFALPDSLSRQALRVRDRMISTCRLKQATNALCRHSNELELSNAA